MDANAAVGALEQDGWDIRIGSGRPGFSQGWDDGEPLTTYHRFGGTNGVRPLVLYRSFDGAFPKYCELDEEFRLYHNLAHDAKRNLLLAFDESGREIEVVRLIENQITAQLKYLRHFQAGTRLHLAFFIDSVRYSHIPVEQVGERHESKKDERSRWSLHINKCDFRSDHATISRLLAKVILAPPPMERAGIWPFDENNDALDVKFVVDVDEDGNDVEYTSNPDRLANYFGANPGAPDYLTPVYFRREVLAKYYAEPERYTIGDGQLSCLGLWNCRIDNNLGSYVVVFLGDLGRDFPYEERLHFRQFNILPEERISETNFLRSFLGEFTEPEAPDLVFRSEYERFSFDWKNAFGWPLFLPLAPGDAHLLHTIRVPTTSSQAEMDEQVLNLTKLIVDSLNEKAIATKAKEVPDGAKGIAKLDAFFSTTGFEGGAQVTQFLRDLQLLRSSGSGHRKGTTYDRAVARLGLDLSQKAAAVACLLEEATAALRSIRVQYLQGTKSNG